MTAAELYVKPAEIKKPRLVSERERINGYTDASIRAGSERQVPWVGSNISRDLGRHARMVLEVDEKEVTGTDKLLVFSELAHRLFWLALWCLVGSVVFSVVANVTETPFVGAAGALLLAASFILSAAWYDRINVERNASS
ncbi:hypothetical protein JQU17_17780 [Ponticoccus sp. SC2-23]|uniref:hypothetical protein n=1 Tax=Alexandriicola marinus TaxID=2081710 RepID=UPI000FD8B988|nr:hypothetical protein [Alexandriicola marinus]MBM1222053.1 hypothetical protein [Ponticoccus sp. SC6-9]MBM1226740.1 hypothetical protein [Ponticoccus sp. SC6-15]MBM1231000.1 hypothetical protein [Ponticoccus sp. SC6-38]MBM1235748.1 hypothetical protein [Ponticoccus sp. SC6-45]MBM1240022.1 hypothetical protein [Ponticoccus sp. SC6-49]MBM1244376.1 hypothetical protein [Ponticoccus sp. SC2-64]MBM1249222.1 hypothetical protein [Ponticoccus sp. SC6-42]MBM1253677.1 hypothetical protein [Pontico